jgi:hypothetical protein
MNNIQKISGLILIGIVGYFIYTEMSKNKAVKKPEPNKLKISQLAADQKAIEIKKIIDDANKQRGGLSIYENDSILQPMYKYLFDNGYRYSNGKALKK